MGLPEACTGPCESRVGALGAALRLLFGTSQALPHDQREGGEGGESLGLIGVAQQTRLQTWEAGPGNLVPAVPVKGSKCEVPVST